jgi:DNA transformation protein
MSKMNAQKIIKITNLGHYMNKDHSDLITLKNLGSASVNILHAVGINSYEDLKKTGPVEVYLRIQRRNIHVSKVMLYALQGALLDTHWNDLAPELKQQLLSDAEETASESQ